MLAEEPTISPEYATARHLDQVRASGSDADDRPLPVPALGGEVLDVDDVADAQGTQRMC